jgi:hypothetical protein
VLGADRDGGDTGGRHGGATEPRGELADLGRGDQIPPAQDTPRTGADGWPLLRRGSGGGRVSERLGVEVGDGVGVVGGERADLRSGRHVGSLPHHRGRGLSRESR